MHIGRTVDGLKCNISEWHVETSPAYFKFCSSRGKSTTHLENANACLSVCQTPIEWNKDWISMKRRRILNSSNNLSDSLHLPELETTTILRVNFPLAVQLFGLVGWASLRQVGHSCLWWQRLWTHQPQAESHRLPPFEDPGLVPGKSSLFRGWSPGHQQNIDCYLVLWLARLPWLQRNKNWGRPRATAIDSPATVPDGLGVAALPAPIHRPCLARPRPFSVTSTPSTWRAALLSWSGLHFSKHVHLFEDDPTLRRYTVAKETRYTHIRAYRFKKISSAINVSLSCNLHMVTPLSYNTVILKPGQFTSSVTSPLFSLVSFLCGHSSTV